MSAPEDLSALERVLERKRSDQAPAPSADSAIGRVLERRARERERDAAKRAISVGVAPAARVDALKRSRDLEAPLETVERNPEWAQEEERRRRARASDGSRVGKSMLDRGLGPVYLDDPERWKRLGSRFPLQKRGVPAPDPDEFGFAETMALRFRSGQRSVEQGHLGMRVMLGLADEDERQRFEDFRRFPIAVPEAEFPSPSFFTGPVVEQAPILFNTAKRATQGAAGGAGLGGLLGAAGGSVIPGVGTAAGAISGATTGGIAGARTGAVVGGFEVEAGNAYAELLDIRDEVFAETGEEIPHDAIVGAAVAIGGVNGILELVGGEAILKSLGGRKLAEALAAKGAQQLIRDAALRPLLVQIGKRVAGAALSEGITEALQETSNVVGGQVLIAAKTSKDPEIFTAANAERIFRAGLEGALAGGGISTGGQVVTTSIEQIARVRESRQAAKGLDDLVDDALDNDLRTNAPDEFRAVVAEAAESDGGDPNVYISAEQFVTYFQNHPEAVDAIDAALPDVARQLPDALEAGAELVIPVADYATYLADHHEGLVKSVRVGADALSLAEAESLESDVQTRLEEEVSRERAPEDAAESKISEGQALEDEFVRELVEAGVMAPEAARSVAVLLRANAERRAQGPAGARAFVQARGVRVEGPGRVEPSVRQPQPSLEDVIGEALDQIGAEERDPARRAAKDLAAAKRRLGVLLNQIREGREPKLSGLPKYPLLSKLRKLGGVDPDSPLAEELRNMGVPRSGKGALPGLFRSGGLADVDQIDASDPLFDLVPRDTTALYLDRDAVLELIDRELRGEPMRTIEEIEAIEAQRQPREELRAELEALQIDIRTASNAEIIAALEAVRPSDVKEFAQGEGDTERGSIRMDPELRDVVIRFTESSDLSTALHELGHLFLEFMRQDAAIENAPAALVADLEAARAYLGVSEGAEFEAVHHEKWARAFEAYLREGNAPSLELQSVFQRFRAWMLNVYRRLRQLDVELDDAIRGVFDRMIASDQAITDAMQARALLPAFATADAAGMTEAEFAAYETSLQRAQGAAREEMDRSVLEELDRVETEEYREAREQIGSEVEAEINSSPMYQAQFWLQRGELLDRPTPEGLEAKKLDRDALVEMYGKAILRVLPRGNRGVWQAKGGLHPDVVADLFGFDSGDALVRALQAAGNREAVIALETEARLKERFPYLEDRIREKAIEATDNDSVGTFLARELRALAKRSVRPATPVQVARAAAQRIVGQTRIRNLRPSLYRNAATRYARASVEAIVAEDWEAAHDAKRKQLLNHYLAQEATRAQDRAEKDRAYLKRFDARKVRERIGLAGESYLDQIDALLERFDLRQISAKAAERRARLAAWIEDQEAAGESVIIDPGLRDEAFRKPWKDLNPDEFAAVADAVRNVDHLATLKRKLIGQRDKREFDSIVEAAVTSILANNDARPESDSMSPTLRDRFRSGLSRVHAWHTKIEFLAELLDGHERQGSVWESVFLPFDEAEARERDMMSGVAQRFRDVFGKLSKVERARMKTSKVFVREIGLSMTREELIATALNVGNQGNIRALMEGARRKGGRGWSQRQLDGVLSHLTRAEWEVVQGVWDMVDSFWPQIAELQRRLTGIAPEKVAATPVTTRFGVYRGGYYPLRANPDSTFVAWIRDAKGRADQLFENNWSRAATKKGHTIERRGFGGQEVWLSLNVLTEHLYNVVHDLTHREAVLDVSKITSDKRFREAVESTAGAPAYRLFRPWLQSIAGEVRQSLSPYDRILGHARAGVTVAYMGFKFTTAFSQIAGVLPAIDRVGLKPMVRAYADFFSRPDQMKARLDFALERSSLLRYRMDNFDREARDLVKSGLLATGPMAHLGQQAQKSFLYLTGLMDMSVSVPTWFAAYQSEMEASGDEVRAIRAGDQAVRFSQGSGSVKDLSAIQRGGELQRIFTMFYSYFATMYNQLGNRVGQIAGGRLSLPQAAASMFWIWFGPAIISELLAGRGPEEDEDFWLWSVGELAKYPALSVAYLRDVVSYGYNRLRGRPFDFDITPVEPAIASLVDAPVGLIEDVIEGDLRRSTVRSWFDAVGFWGKLPTRQVWITSEAIYDLMTDQGEFELPRDLFFARPPERKAQ